MLPPSSIPVTIDVNSLTKVKAKRVLGIIIDEDLTFIPHIEYITKICKLAYSRLTLHPDLTHHLALQVYKAFIRSKLEFGCTVWGFRIHNAKHLKHLESAQRAATLLILKTMISTPTDGLESEVSILYIDLHLEEHQRYEAVKLLIKEDEYIQSNMVGRNKAYKIGSLFENLRANFCNNQAYGDGDHLRFCYFTFILFLLLLLLSCKKLIRQNPVVAELQPLELLLLGGQNFEN